MKWLIAMGLTVLLGVALVGCKMNSDDNQKKAEKVNPEDIIGRAPPGIHSAEGSLYEVTGLQNLISYGDSLLVQVTPIASRLERNWSRHERKFRNLIGQIEKENGGLLIGPRYGNFVRLTDRNQEEGFSYYYFNEIENSDKEATLYILRAFCASPLVLYEADSGCFFGYRTEDKYIEFTLDERTVKNLVVEEIENHVFSQLNIEESKLRWVGVGVLDAE